MGLLGFIQYGGHPHQGFLCGGDAGQEGQDLPPWQQHQLGLSLKGSATAVRLAAPGLLVGPRPQGLVGSAFLAEAPGDVVRLAARRAASPGSRWTWITPSGRVAPRASAFGGHGEEGHQEPEGAKGGAAEKAPAQGGGKGKEDSIVIEIKLPEWIRKRGKEGPPAAGGKENGLAIDINLPPDWKKNPEAGAAESVEPGPVRKGGTKTAEGLEEEADKHSTASEEELEQGMVDAARTVEDGQGGNKGAENQDVADMGIVMKKADRDSTKAEEEVFVAMKKETRSPSKDKMHQQAEHEADRFAAANPKGEGELENPTCCRCGDKKVKFSPEGNCAECKEPPKKDTDRLPMGEGDCTKMSAKTDKLLGKECKKECSNMFQQANMENKLHHLEARVIPEPKGPRCCVCVGTGGKEGTHPVVFASKVDECADRCGGDVDETFSAPKEATKKEDPKAQDEACQKAERKDVIKEANRRKKEFTEKEVQAESAMKDNKLDKEARGRIDQADELSSEVIDDFEKAELKQAQAAQDGNKDDEMRHLREESDLLQDATKKQQKLEYDIEKAQLLEAENAEHGHKRLLVAPKPDKTNGAMCCECTKGDDEDAVSVVKWTAKGTPCKEACKKAGQVSAQFPASQRCQIKKSWFNAKRRSECLDSCKYRIEVALEEQHEAEAFAKGKKCKGKDCMDHSEE